MNSFDELVRSRREWIADQLAPWCRQARRRDLLLAEADWINLAGKGAPEKTLWFWAWSRFPLLCNSELMSINETDPVTVQRVSGESATGFPDARASTGGLLGLVSESGELLGPFSIDEIQSVDRG